MWYLYLITGMLCILLIWRNKKNRNVNITKYVILSILFPHIGYGLWEAEKPLIDNEKRHGGKGWNVMKWVGIIHTIMCVIFALYIIFWGVAQLDGDHATESEIKGIFLSIGWSIMLTIVLWFFGIGVSLILGLILKKPIIETAQTSSATIATV